MTSISQDGIALPEGAAAPRPSLLAEIWEMVRDFVATGTGKLVLLLIVAMGFCFAPVVKHLPEIWFGDNSYFTHGVLVPFLVIYILYDRRAQIAATPVKPMWWPLILLVPLLYACFIASRSDMMGPLSYAAVTASFLVALTVGGWRMTWALAPALFFLAFALPFGQGWLDAVTVKFQGLSTDMAFQLLKLFHVGDTPMRLNSTQIIIGDYSLYVAAACSGLKLTLSVTTFVALFMIVGRLKWWANLILVASILPLCILVNGIRIAMIGAVGCYMGDKNAATFHDWSGYLSIVICFFLLMKLTRALGWK